MATANGNSAVAIPKASNGNGHGKIERLATAAPLRFNGKPWPRRHVLAAIRRAEGCTWDAVAEEAGFSPKGVRSLVLLEGWQELLEWAVKQLWKSETFAASYRAAGSLLDGKETDAVKQRGRLEALQIVLRTRDMFAPERHDVRVLTADLSDGQLLDQAERIASRRRQLVGERGQREEEQEPLEIQTGKPVP